VSAAIAETNRSSASSSSLSASTSARIFACAPSQRRSSSETLTSRAAATISAFFASVSASV